MFILQAPISVVLVRRRFMWSSTTRGRTISLRRRSDARLVGWLVGCWAYQFRVLYSTVHMKVIATCVPPWGVPCLKRVNSLQHAGILQATHTHHHVQGRVYIHVYVHAVIWAWSIFLDMQLSRQSHDLTEGFKSQSTCVDWSKGGRSSIVATDTMIFRSHNRSSILRIQSMKMVVMLADTCTWRLKLALCG